MAVKVSIEKHIYRDMGGPAIQRATIKVRPTDSGQHPSLPFQEAGSIFKDRTGAE